MKIELSQFSLVENIVYEGENYVRVIDEFVDGNWFLEEDWCNRAMERPEEVENAEELEAIYQAHQDKFVA